MWWVWCDDQHSSLHIAQLLVQALVLSRLDYYSFLLAGLSACASKHPQLIQNSAAQLAYSLPKCAPVTPLLISLQWLPVTAHIRFKTLVLAYRAANGTAPPYFQSVFMSDTLAISLPDVSPSRCLSVLAPQRLNDIAKVVSTAVSLSIFWWRLKTQFWSGFPPIHAP